MPPSPTWKDVRQGLARTARAKGEWAGLPMPMEGMRMVVHPSYPFAESLGQVFMPKPATRFCRTSDVQEDVCDGPAADWTLRLGVLVLRNPMLCEFLDRVSTHTGADRATMMACMVAGLNYGLRIGEARVNAVMEKR